MRACAEGPGRRDRIIDLTIDYQEAPKSPLCAAGPGANSDHPGCRESRSDARLERLELYDTPNPGPLRIVVDNGSTATVALSFLVGQRLSERNCWRETLAPYSTYY